MYHVLLHSIGGYQKYSNYYIAVLFVERERDEKNGFVLLKTSIEKNKLNRTMSSELESLCHLKG